MTADTASCGHTIIAVGAPNSVARTLTCSVPCPACQEDENRTRNLNNRVTKWKPCPACGYVYDCTIIPPPLVPSDIRCACCCR